VFRVNSKHYREAYKLLVAQLVLGFVLFYAVVWSSYVVLYFSLGNVLSGWSVALLGLPSSLWGLWVLRNQLRPRKAALIANFGGCAVLIGITASTGAAASPIYAWFFFVTITTFLLNGRKAGYTMAFTTMAASCFIIGMDIMGRRLPTGFSFQVGSTLYNFFIAYTYVTAIFSLAVVTHIYDRSEKLVSKARVRGLIAAQTKLTEAEAIQLIFVPSLSTKDLETEISGRGFGMEAVRAAIEELGGAIRVDTQRQKGTCFTITIPLQMKIPSGLDGMKRVS